MREIGLNDARMLLEPMRRNTAPAIATAALQAMENGEDPVLLVLPSDHVILDTPAFHHAISLARQAAEQGKLLTFGITPTGPETG
ncbi:sugar phosphate nucleotidyltransferase, partial [Mesorhizobium japonicum]